eukprot:CAMPEP_0201576336 /NCGR_PEP_ID=MMETSP0190_2-20130828/22092_1 /ASSEMBLY_ACC=CAM_ASM_000263 /TAXON_ID=37353 /ORGANISM="Rosalina sp." /LENGTH=58 /DNA_ID=CAMNT_0048007079 /DNA_START=60 /DNA_END=232 /DNA_ORIENTATION=-
MTGNELGVRSNSNMQDLVPIDSDMDANSADEDESKFSGFNGNQYQNSNHTPILVMNDG